MGGLALLQYPVGLIDTVLNVGDGIGKCRDGAVDVDARAVDGIQ